MARIVCKACGAKNPLKASVCAECGAHLRDERARPAQGAEGKGAPLLFGLLDLVPGLVRARTLVWVLVMLVVAAAVGAVALWFLQENLLPATLLVGVLAMVFYCTAVIWVLYGYVCVPSEAVVEFDGLRWLLLVALTLVPIGLLMILSG